jgi:chemotaxis signal transduction protein
VASAFQVLSFRIGDRRFAVPLLALHSVVRLEQRPRLLPGQGAWQIGCLRYRDQTVVVIDLARLLGLAGADGPPRYLLVLDGGRLALACDALGEVDRVEPAAVRWRRPGAAVQWLAGVVVGSLCLLLDAAAIEREFGHG